MIKFFQRVVVLCLLTIYFSYGWDVSAQSAELSPDWTLPQKIIGYPAESSKPVLIADQNRMIHAFNTVSYEERDSVVVYSKWDRFWNEPTDILLSPIAGSARLLDAKLDSRDYFHVIYYVGNELGAQILYSTAPAAFAERAQEWSSPILVGNDAGPISSGMLLLDDQDRLMMLFTGRENGKGLYAAYSADNGSSWSDNEPIYLTYDSNRQSYIPKGTVSDDGTFHFVWSVVNETGNGQELVYANFEPLEEKWSELQVMARRYESGFETDQPNIVSHDGGLIMFFQQDISAESSVATRWYRQSFDNGATWTEPIRPFPHVGTYGAVSFSLDADKNLHLITGGRVGSIHGLWVSQWQGDKWSELNPILKGPRVVGEIGGNGFDPAKPASVVSQGNLLFAAWETDPGAGHNGVWYAYTVLDAAESPIVPLQVATPMLTDETISAQRADDVVSAESAALLEPPLAVNTAAPAQNQTLAAPLIISASTVAILIVALVLIQTRRKSFA